MKYKLKVYSIWECGQRVDSEGKPHQEDSIFPAYGQQKESDRLFILCDGMGGHEAGEVASSTVCTAMSNSIHESSPNPEGEFSEDNLRKAIADAFDSLDALPLGGVSAEKKMGTTMTLLKFHDKGCTIAHMGDSRVYHIRPGKGRDETKILFKTNDHSLVNDLIKVGELTPEEAKLSKQKNIITRAMQPKMERRPKPDVFHTVDIKPGDYFYMCSDGMLEQMEDEYLPFYFSDEAGDDENKIKTLTLVTNQNLDNHSAIIIHVLDVIDPLPIEVAPILPAANKPAPIMAEVDEDSQDEKGDAEKEKEEDSTDTEDSLVVQTSEKESLNPGSVDAIPFDNTRQNGVIKNQKGKNIKLIKYTSLILLISLLALGLFFISSRFSKSPEKGPEKIENPQKPTKKTERRHHGGDSGQNTSQQSPDKPNDSSVPDNPNSSNQASTGANSVNSTVPNKIQNALSSQASQSGGNGNAGITGNINSAGGNHHNNISSVNLNQVSPHGEDVVSSDQQAAMDLPISNTNKKK